VEHSDGNQTPASLVYVEEDNFPGAYRVTGTYNEENGLLTVETVLRKDGKIVAPLENVSGKKLDEVTKKLLTVVLKMLEKVNQKI